MLYRHGSLRNHLSFCVLCTAFVCTSAGNKHGTQITFEAAVDHCQWIFCYDEFEQFLVERKTTQAVKIAVGAAPWCRGIGHVQEVFRNEAFGWRFKPLVDAADGIQKNEFSFQFALVFFKVGFIVSLQINHFSTHEPFGAGRPGLGISNDREIARRSSVHFEMGEFPTPAKWAPGFEVNIAHAPIFERFLCPVSGFVQHGRTRQTWSVYITNPGGNVHHLAFFHTMLANGGVEGWIGCILCQEAETGRCGQYQ